jgi:hypothetical protein
VLNLTGHSISGGASPLGKQVAATPSEPQGAEREDGAERSGERNRESMHKNRMSGDAGRGERTDDREAPTTKGQAA